VCEALPHTNIQAVSFTGVHLGASGGMAVAEALPRAGSVKDLRMSLSGRGVCADEPLW
jgi:hypothetical protein